ncbi:hypothetical protein ACJQWY_01190 [Weissella kandleri]|uniref:hypothetical protein n=1 Tax=Weissella kandleri TaxID=1616 RepID=UPI00387E8E73
MKTNDLIDELIFKEGVQMFEQRKQYTSGYDIEITKRFENGQEKRHPKMPDEFVAIIVPKTLIKKD